MKAMVLTKAQRLALKRKFDQDPQGLTYRGFRRTVWQGWGCIMVPWCGMDVGIEPDGHIHT